MIKITQGRLRAKLGGIIEDLPIPIIINSDLTGWQFISNFKDLISKDIVLRYNMLYSEEVIKWLKSLFHKIKHKVKLM